jgi:hypothetical protein
MKKTEGLRWDEDDPRDVKAKTSQYNLRVKAEQRGTVWVVYLTGKNLDHKSEHVSKDAAKQKAAKILRELLKKDKANETQVPEV